MATKTIPHIDLWAVPFETQSRYRCRSVALCDQLCNLDRGEANEAGYTGYAGTGSGSMPVSGASQGGHIHDVDNLQWWNLFDELDKTQLAGYTLAQNKVPLNCIVHGETGINPPSELVSLVWKPTSGQEDYWQTCLPDREPLACGIRYTKVSMDEIASAVSDGDLPAGQQFHVELQPIGFARADSSELQPWLRLTWGGQYCIYLASGRKPELGRKLAEGHEALRNMDNLSGFWSYNPIEFAVHYLGGRLVLAGSGGQNTIYTNRVRNTNTDRVSSSDSEGKVLKAEAPKGPLHIESQGVAFVLRLQEIATGDTTVEENLSASNVLRREAVVSGDKGSFKRKFYASQRPVGLAGYPLGYHPSAMNASGVEQSPERMATVTFDTGAAGSKFTGEASYTCELQATNTGKRRLVEASWRDDVVTYDGDTVMRGHQSPLVHSVTVNSTPVWSLVGNRDPLSLRPATLRVTETCADPALQTGLSVETELNRNYMPDLPHPSGIGTMGNDWTEYVGQYRPLYMDVGWMYTDGVARAYTPNKAAVGASMRRFVGVQQAIAPGMPSHNKRTLTVSSRDPIFLLQAPHGVVDGNYAAFDFLYLNKCATSSPDRQSSLWGADCIKYLLKTRFGSEGAALQVFYPGFTGLWGADSKPDKRQWALYDYLAYTDPPSGSGLIWPPPFGSSVLDWIQKVTEIDFAVFFYGTDWNDSFNVGPCYGNYFEVVRGAPTTLIPDAKYVDGDEDIALMAADYRQMAEADYNRFLIWGQVPGGSELGGMMPAVPAFSAESKPMDDSPRHEQRPNVTWQRTKIMQGPQFYMPGVARQIVAMARTLMFGAEIRRVTIKHRGIEWLWWGQKVQLKADSASSDPQLLELSLRPDLTTQTFRVMRVVNTYDLEKSTWQATTSLADQPVSW